MLKYIYNFLLFFAIFCFLFEQKMVKMSKNIHFCKIYLYFFKGIQNIPINSAEYSYKLCEYIYNFLKKFKI